MTKTPYFVLGGGYLEWKHITIHNKRLGKFRKQYGPYRLIYVQR